MPIQVPDIETVYQVASLVKYGWRLCGDSWIHPQGQLICRNQWSERPPAPSEYWTLEEAFSEVEQEMYNEVPNAPPGS